MTMRLNGFTRQELTALRVKAQRSADMKGLNKIWASAYRNFARGAETIDELMENEQKARADDAAKAAKKPAKKTKGA